MGTLRAHHPQDRICFLMTLKLSERLRSETREAHTAAERSGIMRDILRGTVSRSQYVELLANLAVIYEALEDELTRLTGVPTLAFIDRAALRRAPALMADILALRQADSAMPAVIRPSARRYAEHLRALGASSPEFLAAHAYLRYLGDLSGGQVLERIIARTLQLESGEGTAFYRFPAIPDADEFKKSFREAIDALPFDSAAQDAFIAETQRGYQLHEALFSELA